MEGACSSSHARVRYADCPIQAFWDQTGGLWAGGKLAGKYASIFVSTGTPGGGQGAHTFFVTFLSSQCLTRICFLLILTESTVLNAISTLTHHGIIFVPLGYSTTFPQLANLTEVRGGSPWGAGTFAGADGSRSPSALELEIAVAQGKLVWNTVSKVKF